MVLQEQLPKILLALAAPMVEMARGLGEIVQGRLAPKMGGKCRALEETVTLECGATAT